MSDTLIARQPIVDKKHKIYGYEILSRTNKKDNSSDEEHNADSDEKQLFNILSTFGMDKLLDGKMAFLNCILENNSLDYFDLISPKNVILEIQRISNDNESDISSVAEKLNILKLKGYKISGGEFCFSPKYESWLKYAEFIKVDTSKYKDDLIIAIIMKAKKLNKKIVLEKIEDPEKFDRFSKYEVDFFQGYYFCKPIIMSAKITNPSAITLIKLINLTMQEADIAEIEEHLKVDPTLSFKLFKYINSYGISGGVKIDTFRKAIQFLGYKNLLKWLSILFTTTQKNATSDLLAKSALVRAKFMENIASLMPESNQMFRESSFIVGLFSLLDAMLNVPLEVAIDSISMPEEVRDAVLHKKGKMAELLNMISSIETNEWLDVFATAYLLNLKTEDINNCYSTAIEWTNSLNI